MKRIKLFVYKIIGFFIPEIRPILFHNIQLKSLSNTSINSTVASKTNIVDPYRLINVSIGKGTYIATNSKISETEIGKFSSIGPNFLCGWGIHPTDGISTSPYFYSTLKQNGETLATENLIEERKPITIGNDVFIGANVTVLDGINIGNGAIIGAGSIVSKDIPDFAIAYGNPIEIKNYRFTAEQRNDLLKMKWWDFDDEALKDVNKYFFDVDTFINKYNNC
ncbi:CatB-related O-acetyltransferase [Winogradskyella poriferorum]|uniref:CatB-related O-acetyltransferase n=1 Tax=Winogradskyella poriferorum TaxID=307627 RepID=UPI003D65BBE3